VLFLGLFKLDFITSERFFAFNHICLFVLSWLSDDSTHLTSNGYFGSLESGTATVHSVSNTDFLDPLSSLLEFGSPIATFLGFGHDELFVVNESQFRSIGIGVIPWR